MKKNYKSILVIVILLVLLNIYLIQSSLIINNILDYSKLFLTKLFPVSFIFFIMSSLLIEYGFIELMNKYLGINTSKLYVFIISMISGFPSGAKYTKELLEKNIISVEEANQIIMFSHFPNPLFVLGSVNLVLKDKDICIKILLSIIISNVIILLFSKNEKKNKISFSNNKLTPSNFSSILSKVITNTFQTMIIIYGTSLFFYLISSIITKYIFINSYIYIFINGIFDLTKGVFTTSLISNQIIQAYYILFFISFGGISIHMQVNGLIADSPIQYNSFLKGRIISTILAFLVLKILLYGA